MSGFLIGVAVMLCIFPFPLWLVWALITRNPHPLRGCHCYDCCVAREP
jgi:hypothetical protein